MFQLGAHTFGFVWQKDASAAFEAIAAAGFRQVQLMASPPHFNPWRADAPRTARLRKILEASGLSLLALDLASSDINLASAAPEVVDFAVDAYIHAIQRAGELGAPWVCIGSGRRHALLALANDRLMDTFRPAFARIHAEAERRGVRLILENHPQGLLPGAADMRDFLAREGYADLPVIYDVANAVAIGEDPADGIATLQGRIGIVHLSDSPKGVWRHDAIGTGEIDFTAIHAALTRADYNGHVVLEILSDDAMAGLTDGVRRLSATGWNFAEGLTST